MLKRISLGLAMALVIGIVVSDPASASPIDEKFGYDVSWPQCGQTLPGDGAFKIIGVNDGRPYYQNPCLTEQISWAGTENLQLYLNTANPGPELSAFWPIGQSEPRVCGELAPDTADCAFNYGYNYAEAAIEMATQSFSALGVSVDLTSTWIWLDVEEENSWRLENTKLNVSSLRGAVYYLEEVLGANRIGFYSVTSHWKSITGNTDAFADYPSWLATASNPALSIEKCTERIGFTGGRLRLTQYIDPDLQLDVNVNCLDAPRLITELSGLRPSVASRSSSVTLRAKLIAETGNPLVNAKVEINFRGKNYKVRTNSSGVAKVSLRAPERKGFYKFTFRYRESRYFLACRAEGRLKVD